MSFLEGNYPAFTANLDGNEGTVGGWQDLWNFPVLQAEISCSTTGMTRVVFVVPS